MRHSAGQPHVWWLCSQPAHKMPIMTRHRLIASSICVLNFGSPADPEPAGMRPTAQPNEHAPL